MNSEQRLYAIVRDKHEIFFIYLLIGIYEAITCINIQVMPRKFGERSDN